MATAGNNSKTSFALIPGWFRCEITAGNHGLTGIQLKTAPDQPLIFNEISPAMPEIQPHDGIYWEILQQIRWYLAGELTHFDVPVGILISGLQKLVLDAVQSIPYGSTNTYDEFAERMGKPDWSAKMRPALKKNPLPLIFPCHRVIQDQNDLGDYVCGKSLKARLLKLESMYS